MTDNHSSDQTVTRELEEFIGRSRWFGGKGRGFSVQEVHPLTWLGSGEDGVRTRIELVTVQYDEGGSDIYQVPLSYYPHPQDRLGHAFVGSWADPDLGLVHAYDALHDRHATHLWLEAFAEGAKKGELVFHRLEGHELDLEAHSTMFSGEQSNSSVAFGEDSLMKVFRRITPGRNPDIEIHEALTRAGSAHVAALYGWLEWCPAGSEEPLHLAMLQQFLRTASDGWDLALTSVRDLYAEGDLHADEVGGDFAAEAHRLGTATAEVHTTLAETFGQQTLGRDELDTLAEAMRRRLADAVKAVPELASYSSALEERFSALGELDSLVVQRIHGDLHLGQTLRTVLGWKIVDFEGEPAKSLAERVRPDSPWRDVAGMLRSFDYAAHSVERDVEQSREQIAYRAREWSERNQQAFLVGYLESIDGDMSDHARALLTAYEADKAVYEAVYETRNRPSWVTIPLGAVQRLTSEPAEDEEAATS